MILAKDDYVIVHGRFSNIGPPVNWIAADFVRLKDGILVEHWVVIQDEATEQQSKSGKPVLLLHGWPDSSDLWRNQIPFLVTKGFRAIAPDQRGFGRSDRPEEVAAYSLQNAVADVVKNESTQFTTFWGNNTTLRRPERVRSCFLATLICRVSRLDPMHEVEPMTTWNRPKSTGRKD